jgi:hypothetical protein
MISATTVFVQKNKYSYNKAAVLNMHAQLIIEIEKLKLNGIMIECGVANGGTAMVTAAAKRSDRVFNLYDTFTGIPAPSGKDGEDILKRYNVISSGKAGENYYGYNKNLLQSVQDRFVSAGLDPLSHEVHFHQGLFRDTLHVAGPVAYAHLDGDWYESTWDPLERIVPHLVPKGKIVLDDYMHWSGCRSAVNDFWGINMTKEEVKKLTKEHPMVARKYDRNFHIYFHHRLTILARD